MTTAHAPPPAQLRPGKLVRTVAADWSSEVLLDDGAILIEHHRSAKRPDTLVVTFDPLLLQPPARPYAVDFLLRAGADVISVRKYAEHFYQPLSRERFDAVAGPVLERYARRLAYGSSLGAYAVLYFCRHGYDRVIASSPRVSVHPRFGVPDWQAGAHFEHEAFDAEQPATSAATVFYDPHDPQDRHFADEEIRCGWPRADWVRLPYAGHPANQFLAEIGFISPYVRAQVQGLQPPHLDRQLKRRSAMYHHVLAEACLAHGKAGWAKALAERALEKSPQLLLARRTLGLVALAQEDWEGAESYLAAFAERYPRDGITHRALHTLAQHRTRNRLARPRPTAARTAAAVAGGAAPMLAAPSPAMATRANGSARQRLAFAARLWRWLRGRQVSRDDIDWAYRSLLGRPPESEAAIAHHLQQPSLRSLVQSILDSGEYRLRLQQGQAQAQDDV